MSHSQTDGAHLGALRRWIDTSKDRALQAGLDARGQRAEIAHALHLVVGQLDIEMIFDAAQQFERLQAVDAQLLEEIVISRKRARRHVEMLRGQVEDLLSRLVDGTHEQLNLSLSSGR